MIKLISLACTSILVLITIGCGSGRNFDGATFPEENSNLDFADSATYNPESLFGFQVNPDGFSFNIFQRSEGGYFGSSVNIQVNTKNQRISVGNLSSGIIKCNTKGETEICLVSWVSKEPLYSFDPNKYIFEFETIPIVAVLKNENYQKHKFPFMFMNGMNDSLISGKKLTFNLKSLDGQVLNRIIHYDFSYKDTSSVMGTIISDDLLKKFLLLLV